jgi:microcompartment protein CcmL/EutN
MPRSEALKPAVAMALQPALAVIELASIAVGIETGDAMVKRAPVDVLRAGTIHPGKYLVLVAGTVGDVEEAFRAGLAVAEPCLVDAVFLPNVSDQVVAALRGARRAGAGEAMGIVETATVAAIVEAADAGVKGASVALLELRLGDGLGGKGYLLFDGSVADVEAAVAIALERVSDGSLGSVPGGRSPIGRVIPQLHREMRAELEAEARFGPRLTHSGGSGSGGSGSGGRVGSGGAGGPGGEA